MRGADVATGTRLGRYEIRRRLGMGGMGLVYEAWDPDLEREVALKLLRDEHTDPDAFKREFRTIADVEHPNLIRLHDLACEAGKWFFTMELVRGTDFHGHVIAQPDATGARIRAALSQLADGLQALHDSDLVHGDVKSGNVLVTEDGRVVLLDFGLTRRHGEEPTDPGSIRGTLAYIAPELGDGAPPTPESDWYSVGVMLYRALTGRYPFTGSPLEVLYAKQDRDPVPAGQLVPASPPDLLEACAALLDRNPWARPNGPELRAMLGERPVVRARARASDAPPFIARPEPLAALAEATAACGGGSTIAIFLRGVSGVGKTSLLGMHATQAAAAGALVLAGRCYERETIPYKGLDSVMEALSRHIRREAPAVVGELPPEDAADLGRLFPAFRWLAPPRSRRTLETVTSGGVTERRRRAVDALRRLFVAIARDRPVVVAIDDMQWGDPDGAALLVDLLAAPAPPGVLVVMSCREEEAERSDALRILGALRRDGDCRDLALGPLPHPDAVTLARMLLGHAVDSSPYADAIARESGGNPNFVGELARLIALRRRAAGGVPSATDSLPTLQEAIAERIAGVPAGAQSLLRVLAVAGAPFEPALAARAAELGDQLAAAVDSLLGSKLIRVRQQRVRTTIEPYHDRIREVAADVTADDARRIHLAIARALGAEHESDPERLAVHLFAGGARTEAARYAVAAASRAAAAFAFDRAASFYAMALEATPSDAPERAQLEVDHAESLANAGRAHAAGRAFATAARRPAGASELLLQLRAGDELLRSGRVDDGLELFGDVLRRLSVEMPATGLAAIPRTMLGRARLWLSGLRFMNRPAGSISDVELSRIDALHAASTRLGYVDPTRAFQLHNEYVLAALRAGEPYRAARALVNEAVALAGVGQVSPARIERLLERIRAIGSVPPPGRPGVHPPVPVPVMLEAARGLCAFNQSRWRGALLPLQRALEGAARVRGTAWETMHLRMHLAWANYFAGELAAFTVELEAGLAEARDRDDRFGETALRITSGYRFLIDDDPEGALREVDAAIADWKLAGLHMQRGWHAEQVSHALLYQGRAAEAWRFMNDSIRRLRRTLIWQAQILRVHMRYRRGTSAATAGMVRQAGDDLSALRRERNPVAAAYAAALEAGIAWAKQDRSAAERYSRAASAFERVGMQVFAASARRTSCRLRGAATDVEDDRLRGQGVAVPARFAATLIPGPRV